MVTGMARFFDSEYAFTADVLVYMVLNSYKKPQRMVEYVSALSLRHVGCDIPTDLFGPFVTGCMQVDMLLTDTIVVEEVFRGSLMVDDPVVDPHVQ